LLPPPPSLSSILSCPGPGLRPLSSPLSWLLEMDSSGAMLAADLAGTNPLTASLTSLTSNFVTATIHSLIMILITEIGDKTFFIAAVLAMRNARLVVYSGAMGEYA
jgi:hypothetical protein